MTYSLPMAKYRNATMLGDVAHKTLRPPRNDQIDILIERQHPGDILAGVQQVDCSRWNIQKVADRILPNSHQSMIGMLSFGAAFEDHGIARLQGERGYLRHNFRAGLKNDSDHTDRT